MKFCSMCADKELRQKICQVLYQKVKYGQKCGKAVQSPQEAEKLHRINGGIVGQEGHEHGQEQGGKENKVLLEL